MTIIGEPIEAIDTPALVVDMHRLEANILRVHRATLDAGLQIRPHIKSHKTPEIAQMQIEAGAVGVTCAKIGEAEVMSTAGIDEIFIAYALVGETKMRRLVALARRTPRLSIAVESLEAARQASDAFSAAGMELEVMVEVDVGAGRTGVRPEEAVPFADEVARMPALRIVGVMAYASHFAYAARGEDALVEGAAEEGRVIGQIAESLESAGHAMLRISGGSTPTAGRYQPGCGLTEIRSGTYVFYDRNQVDIGSAPMEQVALSVLATVVATPTEERAIIDAGTKGLSQQVGTVSDGYGWLPGVPGARVVKINDEHGFVDVTEASRPLAIGEKLEVIPARAPTCLNLYDRLYAVRDDVVEDIWRVAARGRNT
ncbi:MAG: alanine racemase [Armatimonadota bacterium]|jgi:D-serine deaminase-like pyridoxal phosphate-dependent protein